MRWWWLVLLPVVLGGLTAVAAWQNWLWFRETGPGLAVGRPGAAETAPALVESAATARDLEARLLLLLQSDGSLTAWYRLADRTGVVQAEQAEERHAEDQIRYGQYLLEQRRSKEFRQWWQTFRAAWLDQAGLCLCSPRLTTAGVTADDSLRVHFMLARLLAQSVSIWPDQGRVSDLQRLSNHLLNNLAGGLPADSLAAVPTAGPVPDPGATPTPKPTATPTPAPDERLRLEVLRLASIDLFAVRELAALDPLWQAYAVDLLDLVLQGYLGDDLPLFAWAVRQDGSGIIPFAGNQPAIDTEEAMLTLLHLCEIGQAPPRSISWIKDQLLNQRAIYTQYHAAQGTALGNQECLPAYAMIARMARILQDDTLYRLAVERLLWHQATSTRSAALSALFRQEDSGQIMVWASDNTWALLALR